MSETILFICTGNYYRSRFAEIYYSHLIQEAGIHQEVFSRGFEVLLHGHKNEGPISKHSRGYFKELGIQSEKFDDYPVQLEELDLEKADRIYLMDSKEHAPMYKKYFPERKDNIVMWDFADDYIEDPNQVLPRLREAVENLVEETKQLFRHQPT